MTKVIMTIDKGGSIMYDCINHADNHDACTIISTLTNVLVEACFRTDTEPTIYNSGHVRIDLNKADSPTIAVFETVRGVIEQVEKQYPEHIKIY